MIHSVPFPRLIESYGRSLHTISLAVANTEYSTGSIGWSSPVALNRAKAVRFGIRGGAAQLRWSLTAGRVATLTEPYLLRPAGFYESLDDGVAGLTFYFASPTAGAVLELEVLSEVTL